MLLFLIGLACTTAEVERPVRSLAQIAGGRLTIDMTEGWSLPAWSVKRDKLKVIRTQSVFYHPKDRPLKGSVLELEGAWYDINLRVNGKSASPASGGLMPVQIPVGDLLVEGKSIRFNDISTSSNNVIKVDWRTIICHP